MHLQVMTAVCGLMLWFIGASTKKRKTLRTRVQGSFLPEQIGFVHVLLGSSKLHPLRQEDLLNQMVHDDLRECVQVFNLAVEQLCLASDRI